MIDVIRNRLTYSGTIATIALFLSMGGGAYALTLPSNSVGTRHIKKDAVRSSDVKNASLRAVDFKPGQLPRGAQGPPGTPGARGAKGETGAPGAPATRLWAVVDEDGSLYRGSGVTATTRTAAGSYGVTFNRDVTNCAAVATTGGHALGPDAYTGNSEGSASAAPWGTAVLVRTNSMSGLDVDRIFHLAVFC